MTGPRSSTKQDERPRHENRHRPRERERAQEIAGQACNGGRLTLALTGAATSSCASGGRCEGTFAELAADCPATFDGTLASFPACPCNGLDRIAYRCGDLRALALSGGYTGSVCYYDSASQRLVGAEVFSDIPDFCGQTSFNKSVGRTPPPSCSATDDRVEQTCEAPSPPAGGT